MTIQRKRKGPKVLLILFVVCISLFVGGSFLNYFLNGDTSSRTVKSEDEKEEVVTSSDVHSIPGLKPVDVYLSMEKQGFKTETIYGDQMHSWISKQSIPGIDYEVSMSGPDMDNVHNVRATAMIDPSQKEIAAAKQFFKYVSSIPYDGANPEKAIQWLEENYNNNDASITISNVKYTIKAPSLAVRMLIIEKVVG
jgi:hypothetical protein